MREHLFDGYDCATSLATCAQDDYCSQRYANGVCNEQCNNAECQWDGGDCISSALDLATDHILIKVERAQRARFPATPTHRNDDYRLLTRQLSGVTRSLLRIVPEPRPILTDDVVTYGMAQPADTERDVNIDIQLLNNNNNNRKQYDNVVLKLDNTNCHKKCLKHIHNVAQFLHLHEANGKSGMELINYYPILSRSSNRCITLSSIADHSTVISG